MLPKRDIEADAMPELIRVLETLSETEQRVIMMRAGLGCERMSQPDIGKEFNVSGGRISQIEAKALKKLRHESRAERIKPLFYTYSEMWAIIQQRDAQIAKAREALMDK